MKHQLPILIVFLFLVSACGSNRLVVANKHFEQGEFFYAIEEYREIYPKLKDREEKAAVVFKLGKSYEGLGEYTKAVPWLKNAMRYNYPSDELPYDFAEVQKSAMKLDESASSFGEILELKPSDKKAKDGLRAIEMFRGWMEKPSLYELVKESRLNSASNETAIAIVNNNTVFIASSREQSTGKEINPVDGKKYADVFVSSYNEKIQKWNFPLSLDRESVNAKSHESCVHVSNDGEKMVICRAEYIQGEKLKHQLFFSTKNGNGWGELREIPFSTDGFDYPQASWSADSNWIIFASNRESGQGGFDIWKSQLNEDGSFEKPINLGNQINTPGDEIYPVERFENTLYFSSDYHLGAGAQDIFKARKDRGKWQISNMKFPINSSADDVGIQFYAEGEKGFLLSNRKGSRGMDVYSFNYPQKLFMCFGKILNDETDSIIPDVNIRIAGTDGSTKRITSNNGQFQAELLPDNEYTLIAYKKGFLNAQVKISTRGLNEAQNFNIEFKQTPTDKPIQLQDIYYETGKWDLQAQSKKSLDELVEILKINPEVRIELSSHTDEVGEANFNMELSQKRATSVVDYLKQKGISEKRLVAKGYGELKPLLVGAKLAKSLVFLKVGNELSPSFVSTLSPEQQEIAKSLNRRTEFEVIGD